jgi:hypothetical protein
MQQLAAWIRIAIYAGMEHKKNFLDEKKTS